MKSSTIILLLTLCCLLFSPSLSQTTQSSKIKNLTPQEVKAKLDSLESILLIDVRTPEEFIGELGHIEGAKLLLVGEIEQWSKSLSQTDSSEIIIYCRSGNRSRRAAEFLKMKSIDVSNMTGGMREWNQLGYPISKEKTNDSTKDDKQKVK